MATTTTATSFVVTFTPTPGTDGIKAVRALLKAALRRHGLRAVDVREPPAAVRRRRQDEHKQERTKMDMRGCSGAAFIKTGDVRDGPIRVVIDDVTEGKYGRPDLQLDDGTKAQRQRHQQQHRGHQL